MSDREVERERAKELVRKLLARTVETGCTEAEALQSAERADRLMTMFSLNLDEVGLRKEGVTVRSIPTRFVRRNKRFLHVQALSRFCDCKVWTSTGSDRRKHLMVCGLEIDAMLFEYLYVVTMQALDTSLANWKKQRKPARTPGGARADTANFSKAMLVRVARRLDEMRAQRDGAVQTASATGTALVVAKIRMVEDHQQKHLQETCITLRKVRLKKTLWRHSASGRAGYAAGDKVNLSRPIGGGNQLRLGPPR